MSDTPTTPDFKAPKLGMGAFLDPRLADLLACPDCGGGLFFAENRLQCEACGVSYDIKNGIPCLYPPAFDTAVLQEKGPQPDMMKSTFSDLRAQLSADPSGKSRNDLWEMVGKNVSGENKNFVNIGCGYDTHFQEYEDRGNLFVNFDIAYRMLYFLKKELGAKSCVAGDVNSLPFKPNSFDYVISIDPERHGSKSPESLKSAFVDLLKPGGIIFLEGANFWGMFHAPE